MSERINLTWRANSGTGSHDGLPSVAPSSLHSSAIGTGLGAVPL